jgi:GT2 family glycosyltransferase
MSSSDYPIATGVPGLVSAIVLNWNGGEEVLKCIEHLVRQSYAQLEILLVDNGSTDGSAKIAQERFPRIAVYKNGRNLGYAEGMNIGIGHSAGEYVLLLNQDAFLEPDYLEQGVKLFGDSETIGMIAGTVLNVGSEKPVDKRGTSRLYDAMADATDEKPKKRAGSDHFWTDFCLCSDPSLCAGRRSLCMLWRLFGSRLLCLLRGY